MLVLVQALLDVHEEHEDAPRRRAFQLQLLGLAAPPERDILVARACDLRPWPVLAPHNPDYLFGACTLNAAGPSRITLPRSCGHLRAARGP